MHGAAHDLQAAARRQPVQTRLDFVQRRQSVVLGREHQRRHVQTGQVVAPRRVGPHQHQPVGPARVACQPGGRHRAAERMACQHHQALPTAFAVDQARRPVAGQHREVERHRRDQRADPDRRQGDADPGVGVRSHQAARVQHEEDLRPSVDRCDLDTSAVIAVGADPNLRGGNPPHRRVGRRSERAGEQRRQPEPDGTRHDGDADPAQPATPAGDARCSGSSASPSGGRTFLGAHDEPRSPPATPARSSRPAPSTA